MPTVICRYGDGNRPMVPISDVLIFTEAEAIERGYFELDKVHKIHHKFEFTMLYNGSYILRPGVWIRINSPEMGLSFDNLRVEDGLRFYSDGPAILVSVPCTYLEFGGRTKTTGVDTIYRIAGDALRVVNS